MMSPDRLLDPSCPAAPLSAASTPASPSAKRQANAPEVVRSRSRVRGLDRSEVLGYEHHTTLRGEEESYTDATDSISRQEQDGAASGTPA